MKIPKPTERAIQFAYKKTLTPSEAKLWKRLHGEHRAWGFSSQVPFGPYIGDFVSASLAICIEVDGGYHDDPKQQAYDARRDRFFRKRGFAVLRVPSADVMRKIEDVADRIGDLIASHAPRASKQAKRHRRRARARSEKKQEALAVRPKASQLPSVFASPDVIHAWKNPKRIPHPPGTKIPKLPKPKKPALTDNRRKGGTYRAWQPPAIELEPLDL